MITDNIIVQFLVVVFGIGTIGRLFLGPIGGFIGLVIGIYLFIQLRKIKKKEFDYDRIEEMFKRYK